MPKEYDAILLLGVGLGEEDTPTDEMHARVYAAAQRYFAGDAPKVIACGGTTPGHNTSEAEVMAGLLAQEGVPAEAIIQENESQDTIGNMRFAAKKLGGEKNRPVLVVTSDYHVRRAVMTARKAGFRASGFGAKLEHDAAWKTLRNKELAYTIDMLLGWQDEGKMRPQWTYALFDLIFGKKQ